MNVSKTRGRRWLASGCIAAMGMLAGTAWAQADYPSKAVRIIAPFPAGSGPDANAREIAAELTKILG